MSRKLLAYPIAAVLFAVALGCHKKEVAPPPPPPPPPVVERTPEPVKRDDSEELARQRRERLTRAASEINSKIVYFDFDRSDIKPQFQSTLNSIADIMKEHTDLTLTVEGHCDERGTEAYNLALGERRANAAREFLVRAGVPASRIQTRSYGEERPVCTVSNESCWSQNRRDEFKATFQQ